MINFPKDYFKDEYREGFLVESMVKRAWAAQLEIMSHIIEICERYNIQYFAFWGTLLGAVRHNGYIPWDDDFDIIMKRKDYDKFLEVAANELPYGYVVISPYTEVEWGEQFARIANTHDINFTDSFLDEYHGFPYVAGIDVFPYDYIPDDKDVCQEKDVLLQRVVNARNICIERESNSTDINIEYLKNELNSELMILEKMFNIEFNRDVYLDNQLLCLYDQIAASYGDESDGYVTCYAHKAKRSAKGADFKIPSYWLDEAIEVSFECTTISIPRYYELCLSVCYGKRYMTPIKSGAAGHDYPFFNKQKDILVELNRYNEVMAAVERADRRAASKEVISLSLQDSVNYTSNRSSISNLESVIRRENKKAIMLCLSSMDYYGDEICCIEKLNRIFEEFRKNSDKAYYIIVNAPLVCDVLMNKNESFVEIYCDVVNSFISEGYGVLIDYSEVEVAAKICDAYYGSYNECVKLYTDQKKPVMVVCRNV